MSITGSIKDMEKYIGTNFDDYMNAPLPHNGQAIHTKGLQDWD